jgi:hypothetical protein
MLVLRTQTKGSPKTDVLRCEMVRKVCASLEVMSSNTDTADTTGKRGICTGSKPLFVPGMEPVQSHRYKWGSLINLYWLKYPVQMTTYLYRGESRPGTNEISRPYVRLPFFFFFFFFSFSLFILISSQSQSSPDSQYISNQQTSYKVTEDSK